MTVVWVGVGLVVLRAVLVPVGHALALRLVLRCRPDASVADAAQALATSIAAHPTVWAGPPGRAVRGGPGHEAGGAGGPAAGADFEQG